MKAEVFHILLSLISGEMHGYAIMREVEQRTGGEVSLLPGVLYRHLHRMLEAGLIAEVGRGQVDPTGDERRRYYRLTKDGREAARAEVFRMKQLITSAEARELLADKA